MADDLAWYDAGKVFPPFVEACKYQGDDDWTLVSAEVLCKQKDRSVSKGQYVLTLDENGELCGDWGSELCETKDDSPIVAWAFIPKEDDESDG